MTNDHIKALLLDHARRLDRSGGAVFQTRAFRVAALAVQGLPRAIVTIFAERGRAGLQSIPGIGKSIAYTIERIIRTGQVETLRDPSIPPREQLRNLRGVGQRGVEWLQEGLGIRTVSQLRDTLSVSTMSGVTSAEEPSVEILLEVDALFRETQQSKEVCRGGWLLRANFPRTALAFRVGMSREWVEIRFNRGEQSGIRLIVTEDGDRVVRGREIRKVA